MKKIYEYRIVLGQQKIEMPSKSRVLSVIKQRDVLVVYVEVDLESKLEEKEFLVVGMEQELPGDISEYKFLGTINEKDGFLIWHVYYK